MYLLEFNGYFDDIDISSSSVIVSSCDDIDANDEMITNDVDDDIGANDIGAS